MMLLFLIHFLLLETIYDPNNEAPRLRFEKK